MSDFTLATERRDDRFVLALHNAGSTPVFGFHLAIAGPARITDDDRLVNVSRVNPLSTYTELAPPAGFVLAPGASWEAEVHGFQNAMHHWTDGPVAAFLIRKDGTTVDVATTPPARAGSPPLRRGTMHLEGMPPVVSVVPWPNNVDVKTADTHVGGLALPAGAAASAFTELTALLFPGERFDDKNGAPVQFVDDATRGPEGYRIGFDGGAITLAAATDTGRLYGLVTLGQMLRGYRTDPAHYRWPSAGHIEDAPVMGFRGSHLDVARRFYPVADIRRFLAILAWNKLNVFHWHLSDDEAWRVEIDAFPALTSVGAWRGHGLPLGPFLGSGAARSGGFYSKAEIRDLVAQAARFGIEIIPEIDIPGHNHALLVALPSLRDPGENAPYYSIQAFASNCLNPGVEAVYGTLEAIIDEMVELFPSRRFHIGADEVPKDAWSHSPAAAALSEKLGTTGSAPLQAHFLRRIQQMLRARGRITGAWEEAAHGGGIDTTDTYMVGWTRTEASRQLAEQGYDVVVAPGQAFYLDMANAPDWHEPGANWAGCSSPEATYAYDPIGGWTPEEAGHLLGVQACIWSEPMFERAIFDRLVFPRLSAIAETGWTARANKDFARFAALSSLLPNLYGEWEEERK